MPKITAYNIRINDRIDAIKYIILFKLNSKKLPQLPKLLTLNKNMTKSIFSFLISMVVTFYTLISKVSKWLYSFSTFLKCKSFVVFHYVDLIIFSKKIKERMCKQVSEEIKKEKEKSPLGKNVNDKWYSNLEPFVLQKTLSRTPKSFDLELPEKVLGSCSWLEFSNTISVANPLFMSSMI